MIIFITEFIPFVVYRFLETLSQALQNYAFYNKTNGMTRHKTTADYSYKIYYT